MNIAAARHIAPHHDLQTAAPQVKLAFGIRNRKGDTAQYASGIRR